MKDTRLQVVLSIVCLLLAIVIMAELRGNAAPQSSTGQAAYMSRLYDNNTTLREQASQLSDQLARYKTSATTDQVSLDAASKEVQSLQVASGATEVIGPGVTVTANGDLTAVQLQDLVNELRNASAEAIGVDGVRVVARSAIEAGKDGRLSVDRQSVSAPYRLEAIGEPDTLLRALERKGGLIALLEAQNPGLHIDVVKHSIEDQAGWLKLPATTSDFNRANGQPTTH